MGLYDRYVLPRLVDWACSCRPVQRQRTKIVPQAAGVVLELGFGTGLNLPHYDPAKVTKLIGLEPAGGMLARAGEQLRSATVPVEILNRTAEQLSLPLASVDTVVVTYTLCSIPDAVAALQGARRALKPGGRLLFCEHGAAPDPGVRRWQGRIEPIWRVIGGGCHLTRDIPDLIGAGGFEIEQLETMYLPGAPRWSGFNFWGAARPRPGPG
ncbi:class I SAM-dependent methyltransferase [Desertibaculum subflavum]|uniref:class I SAM-dependent methyltransferase n=1 Tax=Desertibaculum subflavum TaxID=2268458 RepID=UPI000E66DF1E